MHMIIIMTPYDMSYHIRDGGVEPVGHFVRLKDPCLCS